MKFLIKPNCDEAKELYQNHITYHQGDSGLDLFIVKDEIKDQICRAINNKKNDVYKWIRKNYPILSRIWGKTDKKHTGVNISKIYETKLILNPENFELADRLGLEILPEHDGVGVFGDAEDHEMAAKVDVLREAIQRDCLNSFGIKPVITVKPVGLG